jgi:hypothetical protein
MVALAAAAPGEQVLAHALPQRGVQLVAVEPPPAGQRRPRRVGDLVERARRAALLLRAELLDLPAELRAELLVARGHERLAELGEPVRRGSVDRAADQVGEDDVGVLRRLVVRRARHALVAGGEREQRGVAREVRRGAGRSFGEAAGRPPGESRAGEPEGEDLLRVHGRARLPQALQRPAVLVYSAGQARRPPSVGFPTGGSWRTVGRKRRGMGAIPWQVGGDRLYRVPTTRVNRSFPPTDAGLAGLPCMPWL